MTYRFRYLPIADARAVSDTTLAEPCALHSAPNENAPDAMRKVAPYRTCPSVLAKNMMYPIIISGAPRMKKIMRLSNLQLRNGRRSVKKAPTMYGGTV